MDILYLIGNGFDKAQGLATSYPEFYDYLMQLKLEDPLEMAVLKDLESDYETWADLENALGNYTAHFSNSTEFLHILYFFNTRLKEYLRAENEKMKTLTLSSEKLVRDLCLPSLYLEPQGRSLFHSYWDDGKIHNISIVSFNYTSTFEQVINKFPQEQIYHNQRFRINNLLHIHGTINDMILVGVNDSGQIANEVFRNDVILSYEFIKPKINEGCQNSRNRLFEDLVQTADIIVLFGISLGKTDNKWWQAIGERMNSLSPPFLLYFPYDPVKNTEAHPNYKFLWSDQYIAFIKERMSIKRSVEDLRKQICVGINKSILVLTE